MIPVECSVRIDCVSVAMPQLRVSPCPCPRRRVCLWTSVELVGRDAKSRGCDDKSRGRERVSVL